MAQWWDLTLDVCIGCIAHVYSLICISHMVMMWTLRKEFSIAVRSPLLALVSGTVSTAVSHTAIIWTILEPRILSTTSHPGNGALVYGVIAMPTVTMLFVGSYILRGLRLLVMYDPSNRKHWGRFLRESTMVQLLVWSTMTLEIAAWIMVPFFSVDTVYNGMLLTIPSVSMAAVLLASIALFGKLRTTTDMFHMSTEIIVVGAFSLMSLAMALAFAVVELPWRADKYYGIVWFVVRFYTAMWFTNILPVREVIRQKIPAEKHVHIVPCLPWRNPLNTNAASIAGSEEHLSVDPGQQRSSSRVTSNTWQSALETIVTCPPLLEAFQDFCRKALCSESLQFILSVREYRGSFHAGQATPEEAFGFARFLRITNGFVVNSAPFEINIGGAEKLGILRYDTREAYMKLDEDSRKAVFDRAEREITILLRENVLHKFKATDAYKHVNDELLAIGTSTDAAFQRIAPFL